MLSLRLAGRTARRLVRPGSRIRPPRTRPALLLPLQRRCYASAAELQRQAKATVAVAAAAAAKHHEMPEKLLIYHAGTGRIAFLATVKVTTLFVGAFFACVAAPGYVQAEKPAWQTAAVALCGLVPLLFVAVTTAPFATHIHIHLPAAARASRPALERFVRAALPPSTELTLTTMSAIAKPRYSTLRVAHLRPAARRFGLVNYVRGPDAAAAENARRRWYNFRAVTEFYVQEPPPKGGGEIKAKANVKAAKARTESWIWDALKDKIAKRDVAAAGKSAGSK